jgi:hypothetical protein
VLHDRVAWTPRQIGATSRASRPSTVPERVFHSDAASGGRPAIQVAKPFVEPKVVHQLIVTRSPNHWCAISCRGDRIHALLVGLRRDRRIEQQVYVRR